MHNLLLDNLRLDTETTSDKDINTYLVHDYGGGSLYEGQLKLQFKNIGLPATVYCADIEPNQLNQARYTLHTAAKSVTSDKSVNIFFSGIHYLWFETSPTIYKLQTYTGNVIIASNLELLDYIITNEPSIIKSLESLILPADTTPRDGYFGVQDWVGQLATLNNDTIGYEELDIQKIQDESSNRTSKDGVITHSDRFGNIITNQFMDGNTCKSVELRSRYSIGYLTEVGMTTELTPIAYSNSDGYLEIALSKGNAMKEFNCRPGQTVKILK